MYHRGDAVEVRRSDGSWQPAIVMTAAYDEVVVQWGSSKKRVPLPSVHIRQGPQHAAELDGYTMEEYAHTGAACEACGVQGVDLWPCSGCYRVIYCGPECQHRDWAGHRGECDAYLRMKQQQTARRRETELRDTRAATQHQHPGMPHDAHLLLRGAPAARRGPRQQHHVSPARHYSFEREQLYDLVGVQEVSERDTRLTAADAGLLEGAPGVGVVGHAGAPLPHRSPVRRAVGGGSPRRGSSGREYQSYDRVEAYNYGGARGHFNGLQGHIVGLASGATPAKSRKYYVQFFLRSGVLLSISDHHLRPATPLPHGYALGDRVAAGSPDGREGSVVGLRGSLLLCEFDGKHQGVFPIRCEDAYPVET